MKFVWTDFKLPFTDFKSVKTNLKGAYADFKSVWTDLKGAFKNFKFPFTDCQGCRYRRHVGQGRLEGFFGEVTSVKADLKMP